MLQRLKKYIKPGPVAVHKYSHQTLFAIICRLAAPTKLFLKPEHHMELLLYFICKTRIRGHFIWKYLW